METKKYRKRYILFFIISSILWLGSCITLIIIGINKGFDLKSTEKTLGTQLLDIFMPMIITYAIGLIVFIFIKEKMRNTVWMVNVIISIILFNEIAAYIILGLWAVDEFIIRPIYKTSYRKMEINKELDKRLN